jgi:hypothetical protein
LIADLRIERPIVAVTSIRPAQPTSFSHSAL